MEWMREESVHLDDPPDGQAYGIRRMYGEASYERLPKSQYMTFSIKNEVQMLELEKCVKSWAAW
jgi:hypothetical protein